MNATLFSCSFPCHLGEISCIPSLGLLSSCFMAKCKKLKAILDYIALKKLTKVLKVLKKC